MTAIIPRYLFSYYPGGEMLTSGMYSSATAAKDACEADCVWVRIGPMEYWSKERSYIVAESSDGLRDNPSIEKELERRAKFFHDGYEDHVAAYKGPFRRISDR